MEHADLLTAIAEVSIAFAGFSGVVGVFGYQLSKRSPQAQIYEISAMVGFSLIGAFSSFFPLLLFALGLSEVLLWRLSSAALLTTLTGWSIFGILEGRRIARLGHPRPRILPEILAALMALTLLALFTNILGLFGARIAGVFLVCALAPLFFAACFFMSLVFSLRDG